MLYLYPFSKFFLGPLLGSQFPMTFSLNHTLVCEGLTQLLLSWHGPTNLFKQADFKLSLGHNFTIPPLLLFADVPMFPQKLPFHHILPPPQQICACPPMVEYYSVTFKSWKGYHFSIHLVNWLLFCG